MYRFRFKAEFSFSAQYPSTASFRTSARWNVGWKWPKRSFWCRMTARCWRSLLKPTVSSCKLWSKTARRHRSACSLLTSNSLSNCFTPTFHAGFSFSCFLSFQEAYVTVVEYFGENPKTTQPSMFFPLFGRFVRAYKVKMCSGLYIYIFFCLVLITRWLQCILIPFCLTEHRQHSKRLSRRRKWSRRAARKKRHHLRTKPEHRRYNMRVAEIIVFL